MRQYRKTLTQLQTMLDLMTGLRKVRENIPVKETISTVFSERRDFVRLSSFPAMVTQLTVYLSLPLGLLYLSIPTRL